MLLRRTLLLFIDMFLLNDFDTIFDNTKQTFPHGVVQGESLHASNSYIAGW